MKLIIDVPEEIYKQIIEFGFLENTQLSKLRGLNGTSELRGHHIRKAAKNKS